MKKILVAFSVAAMLTIGSTAAMAASTGDAATAGPAYNSTEMQDNLAPDDATNDNGIINANKSGVGVGGLTPTTVTRLSGTETKTHQDYAKNTNACAACHQTHTAAGAKLLIKSGVYDTCTACHDGTLGFYNVFGKSSAGTFGGTTTGNMSVHMANDTVAIKAAPGGNMNALDTDAVWGAEFDCASCHAPHGSLSDRLLNFNPNDMGLQLAKDGGLRVVSSVYSVAEASVLAPDTVNPYIAVRGSFAELGLTPATVAGQTLDASTVAIVVYELSGTKYVKSTTPWLAGIPYSGNADARLLNVSGTQTANGKTAGVLFNFAKGYVAQTSSTLVADAAKVDIGRAYVVKLPEMALANSTGANAGHSLFEVIDAGLWTPAINTLGLTDPQGLAINAVSLDGTGGAALPANYGVKMSKFCAACHTDYMNKSGAATTGTFDQAYRHTTTKDTYTCLRCHFAHGSDVSVMKDANGKTAQDLVNDGTYTDLAAADAYMIDTNPSSALKKFTNMSVCWGCHTSSHNEVFANTTYYQNAQFGATAPTNGLPAGN